MSEKRVLVVAHSARDRDSVLWRYALGHDDRFDLVVPLQGKSGEAFWAEPWIASGRVIPLREVRLMSSSQTRLLYRGLDSLALSGRYDFAHIATEPWSLLAQTVRRHLPIAIQGAETIMMDAPIRSRLRRLGGRKVLGSAVGVAAWGRDSLDEFIRCGVPETTPTAVIPMGIPDPSIFTCASPPTVDGVLRLLFVGRLAPEKGVEDLIRAILANPGIRLEVRIAGAGPEEHLVRRAVQQDSRIQYLGPIEAPSVHEQLSWSTACVIPSRRTRSWTEQWGRIAVEAILSGRPIITSDSGELRHLNPSPELIFPAANELALGNVIRQFSEVSSRELEGLCSAALQKSRDFVPESVYRTLEKFWSQVLER